VLQESGTTHASRSVWPVETSAGTMTVSGQGSGTLLMLSSFSDATCGWIKTVKECVNFKNFGQKTYKNGSMFVFNPRPVDWFSAAPDDNFLTSSGAIFSSCHENESSEA
jgi:hypothetical protein